MLILYSTVSRKGQELALVTEMNTKIATIVGSQELWYQ